MENDTIVVETSKRTIRSIFAKSAALVAVAAAGFVLVNRIKDDKNDINVQS